MFGLVLGLGWVWVRLWVGWFGLLLWIVCCCLSFAWAGLWVELWVRVLVFLLWWVWGLALSLGSLE